LLLASIAASPSDDAVENTYGQDIAVGSTRSWCVVGRFGSDAGSLRGGLRVIVRGLSFDDRRRRKLEQQLGRLLGK
jgi:hypothetical protein